MSITAPNIASMLATCLTFNTKYCGSIQPLKLNFRSCVVPLSLPTHPQRVPTHAKTGDFISTNFEEETSSAEESTSRMTMPQCSEQDALLREGWEKLPDGSLIPPAIKRQISFALHLSSDRFLPLELLAVPNYRRQSVGTPHCWPLSQFLSLNAGVNISVVFAFVQLLDVDVSHGIFAEEAGPGSHTGSRQGPSSGGAMAQVMAHANALQHVSLV